MDPALRRILDTPEGETRDRLLASIVETELLPLARAIVARKLRTYSGRTDRLDRDDVVSDAMATLLERLRAIEHGAAPIDNLVNYAATVVHSACAHYVRRRYPERARLKSRLRYVLSTASGLALWPMADGDLACGQASWKGAAIEADGAPRLPDAVSRNPQPWKDLRPAALARALTAIFKDVGRPLPFEALVAAVAAVADLREPRESLELTGLAAESIPQDLAVDQRRLLARVWDELRELPVAQRVALLLNLRGPSGAGVLWLFPVAGVATVRQIARVLEIAEAEFASLWREIPIDDETIARRLGCTRQQVINLRMAGRKRLANRLRGLTSALSPVAPRAANLQPDSSSLKGSM